MPDILILEPRVFGDSRGFFMETFNEREFQKLTGLTTAFVQDNHSRSARGVLRGLHYQVEQTQGKLVRVTHGAIFDVAVDLRRSSAQFGHWTGVEISAENKHQMWVPPGFAHGFFVLSETADVMYKTTDYYAPEHERCLAWDDPAVGVLWPVDEISPVLSEKDSAGTSLDECDTFP